MPITCFSASDPQGLSQCPRLIGHRFTGCDRDGNTLPLLSLGLAGSRPSAPLGCLRLHLRRGAFPGTHPPRVGLVPLGGASAELCAPLMGTLVVDPPGYLLPLPPHDRASSEDKPHCTYRSDPRASAQALALSRGSNKPSLSVHHVPHTGDTKVNRADMRSLPSES